MSSLRQFRWFAMTYFFGLYVKYFINLKTLALGGHWPRCPPGYAPGGVHVHNDSVIQINQHNFQQSWNWVYIVNMYSVSTVIMFTVLICSMASCWRNVSNSNVTMKFAQLHFLAQNIGGQKILCPPCPQVEGGMFPVPSLNSVPALCSCWQSILLHISRQSLKCAIIFNNTLKMPETNHEVDSSAAGKFF